MSERTDNRANALRREEGAALLEAYVLMKAAGINDPQGALAAHVRALNLSTTLDALADAVAATVSGAPALAASRLAAVPLRKPDNRARRDALVRNLRAVIGA